MKCMSCAAEIPPSFIHAIQTNTCAGCGGPIMDDGAKELMTELKEAMAKMPNDAQGVAGWLLSNYTLKKIGTAEPTTTFHRKPIDGQKRPLSGQKLKVAKNTVQEFLKRKDPGIAKNVAAQKDFASIVNQINNGKVSDPYGNGVDLESEIDAESEEFNGEIVSEGEGYEHEPSANDDASGNDPYEEAEYNRQNFQSTAKQLARHSLVMSGNERPLSAQETAAMMHAVAGQGNDIGDNMPDVLQAARMERLRKQREIASGGTSEFGDGRGSFRRG